MDRSSNIKIKEPQTVNDLFKTTKIRVKIKDPITVLSIPPPSPTNILISSSPPPSNVIKCQKKIKITVKPKLSFEEENLSTTTLCSSNLWSEKYRPKQLSTLIGNCLQIEQIRDWFLHFKARDTTIKKALLFSGSPGTSKTTVAHIILKEFGYDVMEYNASDVRSKKLVEENLEKLITMDQVDKHFKHEFHPFGIIMDEVDGMSSGDRGGMSQLIKTINPNYGKRCVKKAEKQKMVDRWIPPIICICNNNYDHKINELKKYCLEIRFEKPSITDLIRVINRVTVNEKIPLTESAQKTIAELAQGDFRRLMFLLQNFSNIKKSPIDANDIYEYYDIVSKKTLDLNSFDITNKIFLHQTTAEEILKLYDTDKSLLPMMVHENYLSVIGAQNTTMHQKLLNCQSCLDSIINGDIIEKMMYNAQSWYLQPIHGLSSCYIPSYYSNVSSKLNHQRAQWTTTLGRFSLQRANMKNIGILTTLLNTGHSYSVDDIQVLSQVILYNLLDPNGHPQVGAEYLKNYNLTIRDLEKLIKVDKLSDKYKKMYTFRQKTQLTRLYGYLSQKECHPIFYHNTRNRSSVVASSTKTIEDENDSDESDI